MDPNTFMNDNTSRSAEIETVEGGHHAPEQVEE
jgi:hypothetical protein